VGGYRVFIALTLILVLFSACSTKIQTVTHTQNIPGPTMTITVTLIQTTEADEVGVFAAVIRQIYTHDDSFGGTLHPSDTLY
jgi:hypothetical protein